MTPRASSYSIGDLAAAAGVSRRTLHFYVQRRLLPPPEGRGRGARYTDDHLARLLRIKEWQQRGVPLDEIRERLSAGSDRPDAGGPDASRPASKPDGNGTDGSWQVEREDTGARISPPAPAPGPSNARRFGLPHPDDRPGTHWFRQPLVAGFELHVAGDRPPLTARQLALLARTLGEILHNGGNEA